MTGSKDTDRRPSGGLVHVYTGDGKGKTTAAFGLAIRAVGRGRSVLIIQFMKPDEGYGEQVSARRLGIDVRPRGRDGWVDLKDPDPKDLEAAAGALEETAVEMASGEWDMVVTDELCAAQAAGLVPLKSVLDALEGRAPGTEVVMTGRRASHELMDAADYVTEMRQLDHPYLRGIQAREGIEY